jgi:hypothetical protein
VPAEVATSKLTEGGIPVERRFRREPVLDEDVGVLLPDHRAADRDAPDRREREDVDERLALGHDVGGA